MKITKIEIQKKNKQRYNLYIDDEFKCGIHEDVIVMLNLRVKMELDQDMYDQIMIKEHEASAKAAALKFISYRMRSKSEVISKLEDLEYDMAVIDKVMAFLDEFKFVNDFEFAKAFIHDKATLSKHPIRRIRLDLKKKGISDALLEKAFNHYRDQQIDFDYDNARILCIKKYKQLLAKDKYNEYELKQRVYQYMVNKGYNLYTVKDALADALLEEPIE